MFRIFILSVIVSLLFVVYEDAVIAGNEYAESTRIAEFFEPDEAKSRKVNSKPIAKVFPLEMMSQGSSARSGSSSRGRH